MKLVALLLAGLAALSACGVPDQQSKPLSAVELPESGSASSSGTSSPTGSLFSTISPTPSGTSTASASSTSTVIPTGSGPVNVLYAGSLVDLMERQIAPAFHKKTGFDFFGFSAGSSALANQIKGKVHQGDVFISASPGVNDTLEGTSNGDHVSWYATFATSPLVIGYNPKSAFAADLKSKPWDQVVKEAGFKLGSTDPQTDPKGALAQQALQAKGLPPGQASIYPEETLVARLQAGQLDAGFFYRSEALAAGIPTVPIGQDLKATYTITILDDAQHKDAARAFVLFLVNGDGKDTLKQDGFDLVTPPKVSGSDVPAELKPVLSGAK